MSLNIFLQQKLRKFGIDVIRKILKFIFEIMHYFMCHKKYHRARNGKHADEDIYTFHVLFKSQLFELPPSY